MVNVRQFIGRLTFVLKCFNACRRNSMHCLVGRYLLAPAQVEDYIGAERRVRKASVRLRRSVVSDDSAFVLVICR
jgi:hypothetical protein